MGRLTATFSLPQYGELSCRFLVNIRAIRQRWHSLRSKDIEAMLAIAGFSFSGVIACLVLLYLLV